MKKIRNRLTYANVMSSLAVFLVLGGATAFAATKIGSNEIKANAILTGKIKKEAVTTGKIKNNAISTSKIANDAVTGDKVKEDTLGTVPNANNLGGKPASEFSPRGFAEVLGDNVIGTKPSLNITSANVDSPSAGIVCFSGLPFEPRGAVATARYDDLDDDEVVHVQLGAVGPCPAGTQLSASTFDPGNPGLEGEAFTILFF